MIGRTTTTTGASSFLRLARMNSPEWAYALVGSLGSMVCGSFSAIFAYILSAVLSVYYAPDPRYMKREIAKYCYLLIGMSSAALLFNTVQHVFWDTVGENLTKRVHESREDVRYHALQRDRLVQRRQ